MSSEALVSVKDQFYERALLPIRSVELELIFNSHMSAEDAELSAAQIAPNSIVFLEGVNLDTELPDQRTAADTITWLGILRIEQGVESEKYVEYKQIILSDIDRQLDHTGQEEGNAESNWRFTIYRKLIEKDCLVFTADLSKPELPEEAQGFVDDLRPSSGPLGLMNRFDLSKGLRRTILDSYSNADKAAKMQALREFAGVVEITEKLISLFEAYPVEIWQLFISPSNKLQAYTVWGTSHAYSLSQKLTDKGYQATVNIIGDGKDVCFQEPGLNDALEQVPNVVLANTLFLAILANPYFRTSNEHTLSQLIEEVRKKKDIPHPIMYIRAFQICKSSYTLLRQLETTNKEDEVNRLEDEIATLTLNLRNLLGEIGLDAGTYVENPSY